VSDTIRIGLDAAEVDTRVEPPRGLPDYAAKGPFVGV
jgi:hypothetical protein